MSRTKKVAGGATTSPVKANITYKPNGGTFEIYFKDSKEKVEDLESIQMIILDADRFSLSGYRKASKSSYVSNYVHNTKKEDLVVGTFVNGKYQKLAQGKYQDIKEGLVGAKYTKNVIGLLFYEGEYLLADLSLIGVAKTTFMDFYGKTRPDGLVTFTVSDAIYEYDETAKENIEIPEKRLKKGKMTTWFHLLQFDVEDIDSETGGLADKSDEELQNYFDNNSSGESSAPSVSTDDEDDDEPKIVSKSGRASKATTVVDEDDSDDLPF
jgi:hypothetical protein